MNKCKTLNKLNQQLVGNRSRGNIFVISAPAGTGKTTLTQMLTNDFPGKILQSISCTTRNKRANEEDGVDYYFISKEEFQKKIDRNEFIEYAKVFDEFYGTLQSEVEKKISTGAHLILVLDTQGAMRIKDLIDAVFIFIAPPDFEELENRLKNRKTESEDTIKKRLLWAENEIKQAQYYDYFFVNEDLSIAYQILKSIIIAEEHRNLKIKL